MDKNDLKFYSFKELKQDIAKVDIQDLYNIDEIRIPLVEIQAENLGKVSKDKYAIVKPIVRHTLQGTKHLRIQINLPKVTFLV